MYASAADAQQFKTRTGNHALTPSNHGGGVADVDFTLLADLGEQIASMRKSIETMPNGPQRAAMRDTLLSLVNRLRLGANQRFQDLFLVVCEKRLPKDTFLALVRDARVIWEQEGTARLIPLDLVDDAKRLHKREKRRRASSR